MASIKIKNCIQLSIGYQSIIFITMYKYFIIFIDSNK